MRILILLAFFLLFLFPVQGALPETFEADMVPWSGYWWPAKSGGVATGSGYRGHPAPLEKYDLVTVGRMNGPATQYGLQTYYDPEALEWEGLCFNWAAAAILEPEPIHRGIYQNTTFLVGDKKALLTVAYHGALYDTYPIRDPAEFHGLLEEFIAQQRMPIMIDIGTEGEVWFYPVFKYESDYTQSSGRRHYTTTIFFASNAVHPDYTGTSVSTETYYYYFEVDGEGNITDMDWEGDSIGSAPVRVCEPFGTAPVNPGIDYDVVKKIAGTDDDPYEENDSFERSSPVSTQTYNLIALDDDFFNIRLKQGDRLRIELASETEDIFLRVYDPSETLLEETAGLGARLIEAEEEGKYTLQVITAEPQSEYLYVLYLEHRLPFQGLFPIKPAGSWMTSVSLLDNSGEEGRKTLSLFDDEGHPQKSRTILPGGPLHGFIEGDFGLTSDVKGYIKVGSDTPLLGLEASMALDDLMLGANLIPLDDSSREIFFPHFSNQWGWKTAFGLLNTGDQTEEILRKAYGEDGLVLQTQTIELAPGERFEEETAFIPILGNGARCMSAETMSGRASLLGYIKFLSPSNGSKGRALVTLARDGLMEIMIPHVASGNYWWTGAAIMNTGDYGSDVLCLAYDKDGNLLATAEYFLGPKENLVRFATDLFPDTPSGDITSIKFSSQGGERLVGLILYGSKDHLSLAGMPMSAPKELPIYVPQTALTDGWWTGIGLVNSDSETALISFFLLDEDGNILAERELPLQGKAHLVFFIKKLFPDAHYEDARYLKIDSVDKPLVDGIYIIGSDDGLRLMGDVIK